jgi:hypothetical protein
MQKYLICHSIVVCRALLSIFLKFGNIIVKWVILQRTKIYFSLESFCSLTHQSHLVVVLSFMASIEPGLNES